MGIRRTVTIKKACELANVSRRTIYNWMGDNKIEYVRSAGGSVRVFIDTLFHKGNVEPEDKMAHYKILCKICGVMISQCRCPSLEKETRYDICDKCKSEGKTDQ